MFKCVRERVTEKQRDYMEAERQKIMDVLEFIAYYFALFEIVRLSVSVSLSFLPEESSP